MHNLGDSNNWIAMLPKPVQDDILSRGSRIKYTEGKAIYSLGEKASATYQLLAGEVNIYTYNNDSREVLLTTLYPNDCFGLMSVLDGLPRGNTAIAASNVELFSLGTAAFNALLQEHADISRSMCVLLSRRTRHLVSLLNESNMLSLRQRIGRLLCRLVPYRGALVGDSAVLQDVTHELIASTVGSSRQSVGREIRELEKSGQISLHYKKITIHDFQLFQDTFYTLLSEDGPSSQEQL